MKAITDTAVAAVFEAYAPATRRKLLALRSLILETAAATPGVGEIEETLKWGQPAYLTPQTHSGSTIRIDAIRSHPTRYAMYFHCGTDLIATFRSLFPSEFAFEGQRAIVFEHDQAIPRDALAFCIGAALTYHRTKASSARPERPASHRA